MTAFDILVILMIGSAAVLGVLRGFVTEILSLIAWVAGVAALRLFYEPGSAFAAGITGTETGGAILAFVFIFLVTFIGFRLIARLLGERTRKSIVGPVDRVLGLGFGAIKGLIGAALLFLLINLFFDVTWGKDEPKPDWLRSAKTYPLLKLSSEAIVDWVEEQRAAPGVATATDGGGYEEAARESLDALLKSGGREEPEQQ
ncbi:CvpA family protein [Sphingoaurantiacus capsulatus]|uniref:CvpA family protein n=1 Tax=Sphingoaurantiacus capsulatus TaxID=1771310 RepID=A0ABV7XC87_9SPHN